MNLLEDLKARDLIYQQTDAEELAQKLSQEKMTVYIGFDPTAASLTVGNLASILLLSRFQKAGHKVIALVGGATGLIGDPSGKSEERSLHDNETVQEWSEKIKQQLTPFLEFSGPNPARVVNNLDWFAKVSALDYLRNIGKHFPINFMLAKDSVDSRLEKGISYTEFSYMILQAYDFYILNKEYDCNLQIGGSDQWGNITAGVDFTRRQTSNKVYGLTLPLVTKADGEKFGKSASGAVWLAKERTSPYQFYQFWINVEDEKVISHLKVFTFLGLDKIKELEEATQSHPEKRLAQNSLAWQVTSMVHGEDAAKQAKNVSKALFSEDFLSLSKEEILMGFKEAPSHFSESREESLVDMLTRCKISSSKRQAREDIKNGAIYLNGQRCQNVQSLLKEHAFLDEEFLIIRRGKKNYHLLQMKIS